MTLNLITNKVMNIKLFAKRLLALTPYRVTRSGAGNRFQAIEDTLRNLASRSYDPDSIIDGGANVGEFSVMARRIWPLAHIHMIEPQISCRRKLEFNAQGSKASLYSVAIGDSSGSIRLAADPTTTSTGAHVVLPQDTGIGSTIEKTIEVPVFRLDDLLVDKIKEGQSCLLKLDLQGYELHALRGATALLNRIDVVLVEVSFYAQAYEPSIWQIIEELREQQFDLHDIASLAGRRRDGRAHQGDFLFVRRDSPLARDTAWS